MKTDISTRHALEAVLVNCSLLHHARLTDAERQECRANMDDLILQMDAARVPFKVQNSLFYIAQKMDIRVAYVADMLRIAFDRVGVAYPF